MHTKNFFISKHKFLSFHTFNDKLGPLVFLPSGTLQKNLEWNLETKGFRITFGFLYWRFQIDVGTCKEINCAKNPTHAEIDEFRVWAKETFGLSFTVSDVLGFLERRSEFVKSISILGFNNYYNKILLAREMSRDHSRQQDKRVSLDDLAISIKNSK